MNQIGLGAFSFLLVISLVSSLLITQLYLFFYANRATGSQVHRAFPLLGMALLHESSRARTMPTDRILTCRFDMTLVGRARSSD